MTSFSDSFLSALDEWQRGWREDQTKREELAGRLEPEALALPAKFRSVAGLCYRKRFLHLGDFEQVLMFDRKEEGLVSWTTSLPYAETFKGLKKPDAVCAAIFEHTPAEDEVILNIEELWADAHFVQAAEDFRQRNPGLSAALFHFQERQGEVILRAPLRGSEIIRLTGTSSDFDELCERAGIPEADRDAHFQRLVETGNVPGDLRYIDTEQSRRAVKRTIQKMHDKVQSLLAQHIAGKPGH